MHFSVSLILAGALVGFLVGLTGMGGGALMTPMLIMLFGVAPLAAVSSDVVASLFMKPVGAVVHLRRGTVDKHLVCWLTVSAAPAAFLGVFVLRALGDGRTVRQDIRLFLGAALLLTLGSMLVKAWLARHRQRVVGAAPVRIRPVVTISIGVFGGLAVGMTSVGSGSLIIGMLLLAYPQLRASQLVGTDLVQAIPLVGAAALGHALFGDVQLPVTLPLLVGALPAVYLGARLSATAANRWVRPVLAGALFASALALVGVDKQLTIDATVTWIVTAVGVSRARRRRGGVPEEPLPEALVEVSDDGALAKVPASP